MNSKIRSHKERAAVAKIKGFKGGQKEAFIEFCLLEDILRLYNDKLVREEAYETSNEVGRKVREENIARFSAVLDLFESIIEAARGAIENGEYTAVWRAIPERKLMRAANKAKNILKLSDMGIALLSKLSDDTVKTEMIRKDFYTKFYQLEDHEKNVRRVKDLPSTTETIEEVVKNVEKNPSDKKNINKN